MVKLWTLSVHSRPLQEERVRIQIHAEGTEAWLPGVELGEVERLLCSADSEKRLFYVVCVFLSGHTVHEIDMVTCF